MAGLQPFQFLEPGAFAVGCNYWASHAGTAMWSDWRPDVVAADFRQLADAGLEVIRVFPLWPDFQPIRPIRRHDGLPAEVRHGEDPLPDTDEGRAGVSAEAMERFRQLADIAVDHRLRLVVGLLTGWMSGRLFVPPALEGRNVLTDPFARIWEVRFVRHFVRRFGSHPAILAWDLGNECNCTARASREEAWAWTSAIAGAIRLEDRTRPVISGMHSLNAAGGPWTIQDQAELTDMLTTHPYPLFTPHCDHDPIATIRSLLHGAAESRFYADIGRKPCLIEETGTLGPLVCNEEAAARFLRCSLFSSWAHDCHGLFWWCAYDFGHLEHAPYDWDSYERELGLLRADRTPKPVLAEMTGFGRFLGTLPWAKLPPRSTQAVCILTHGQDNWGAAFASFILAKQAGFDVEFQHCDQPLRDAPLYLLPSICGAQVLARRHYLALLERVRAGATLHVSLGDAMLSPFTEQFGLEVLGRRRRDQPARLRIDALPRLPELAAAAPFHLQLVPTHAAVLGREPDGSPAFTCATLGKGRILLLTAPIETYLVGRPGAFHGPGSQPFWRIYEYVSREARSDRAVSKREPNLGVTEHTLGADKRAVVAINYSPEPVEGVLQLAAGWKPAEVLYPAQAALGSAIRANDALVFTIERDGRQPRRGVSSRST